MPAYHINTQKCQNENAAKTVTKSKTKMILITKKTLQHCLSLLGTWDRLILWCWSSVAGTRFLRC